MFSWIFPQYCCFCKREGQALCEDCLDIFMKAPKSTRCTLCSKLQPRGQCCPSHRHQSTYTDVLTVYRYATDIIRKVIISFKYKARLALAEHLASAMVSLLLECYGSAREYIVVPLPSPKKRISMRAYSPTVLLAEQVAKKLSVPVISLLACRRNPLKQASLGRVQRRQNMKNVFVCLYSLELRDKTIILVDDVITTGSTLLAAMEVVQSAISPKEIIGLTFAQNT